MSSLAGIVIAVCAIALGGSSIAAAFQVQIQFQVAGGDPPAAVDNTTGLSPPQDRDAESWLKRAEEAAAREDWKLAADTLARVIADDGHRTVSLDGGVHFYSAAWCAQEQIRDWPSEGVQTYRVLYDGDAQALFDEARASHDLNPLRTIVSRFPMTTIGPAAADLLSAWLLDRGQATEALDVLNTLSGLPHKRIDRFTMVQRLVVAYALTDQRRMAVESMTKLRDLVAVGGAAGAGSTPGDRRNRFEATLRFFEVADESNDQRIRGALARSWPQLLGPAVDGGRAGAVSPVITPDVPWHDELPGADTLNVGEIRRISALRSRPPVWQGVTDRSMLFVTTPGGLMARDLATFDLAWQAFPLARPPDPEVVRFRRMTGFMQEEPDPKDYISPSAARSLFHEYAGAVTTAFGLVFIIEQNGTPGETLPDKQGRIRTGGMYSGEAPVAENTLRAFEAATGRARWAKGRAAPVGDGRTDAHFFSPPVAAGPRLVAPFQLRNDLYLAVLEPDGTLVKKVLIGSGQPGTLPINSVLLPTVADGTIYVQTGGGMFVALGAVDFSLRWLAMYDRVDDSPTSSGRGRRPMWPGVSSRRAYRSPDEWLCSPPLVVGGKVILAAADSDKLLAFDRRDGRSLWEVDRGKHRYLVGADRQRIILAGRGISAISLETGEPIWRYADHAPLGRPAYCGNEVLVPTEDGLLALSAESGKPVGEIKPSDAAFGNLLVADGALYSLSATTLHKYPDMEQTRRLAEQRLALDPNDVDAIVRLAWLAGIADDWAAALDMLDRVAPSSDSTPPSAQPGTLSPALRVSRLRVTALMRLAESAGDEQRIALLERATATALRPDDVVTASLALSDALAAHGRAVDAFEQALALLLSHGDQDIELEPGRSVLASVLIGQKLRRYVDGMNAETLRRCMSHAQRLFDSSLADPDAPADRIADALPFDALAADADLALARRSLAAAEYETAVFYLERAVRRAADTGTTADALALLATTLARPGEGLPAAPVAAEQVLRRLVRDHAEKSLPPDDYRAAAGLAAPDVMSFVDALGSSLASAGAGLSALGRRDRLHVVHQEVDTSGRRGGAAVGYDAVTPDESWLSVAPVLLGRQVKAVNLAAGDAGALRWSSAIDAAEAGPSAPTPNAPNFRGAFPFPGMNQEPKSQFKINAKPTHAAVAGRIAAVHLGNTILPVGLTTGRCAFQPIAVDTSYGDLPDPPLLAIDGLIIAATDSRGLIAIRARDGATPIWRRRFRQHRLGYLGRMGDRLVVIDRNATRLWLIDPATGRDDRSFGLLVGKVKATTEDVDWDADDPDARVALVGSVVLRNGLNRVVARDIATGRMLWDRTFAARIKDLTPLDDRHVGISHGLYRFDVVRADSGETIKAIEFDDLELPPILARIDRPAPGETEYAPRLIVFARTDDLPPMNKIVSYGLDDSPPWEAGPYDVARITPRMLRASPDVLPVLLYEVSQNVGRRAFGEQAGHVEVSALILLNKQTGARLGRRFAFDETSLTEPGRLFADRQDKTVLDAILVGERIMAVTRGGFCILEKEPVAEAVSAKMPRSEVRR